MKRRHDNPTATPPAANGRPAAWFPVQLDPAVLRPIVEAVVSEVLAQLDQARAQIPDGRLA